MLNVVTIMGRLTATPELKTTPGGASVTSFTLAVDRDFKNKETGERSADFINVVAWRGTAEFVTRYFTKGRMAVVNGKLQVRKYTDKDGNNRYTTEVVAENVYFGDSNTGGNGNTYSGGNTGGVGNTYGGQQTETEAITPNYEELSDDDEPPF